MILLLKNSIRVSEKMKTSSSGGYVFSDAVFQKCWIDCWVFNLLILFALFGSGVAFRDLWLLSRGSGVNRLLDLFDKCYSNHLLCRVEF